MAQIIGYRKDRLGARIMALGNLLCLEDTYGVSVRYLWPDAFEMHDMAIESAFPIFDDDFSSKYLEEIPANKRPDIDDLTDIDTIRGRSSTDLFRDRVAMGEQFLCSEGIRPLLFSNETTQNANDAFRKALSRIVWSPRVQSVLNQAAQNLADLPGARFALHVRRGDILDKDPWLHKNWTSKFAPDEFYDSVMDRPDIACILFSDTPAVAARMAFHRPNVITFDDLVDAPDLSEMQRDLVELLLMAQCDRVVAPSLSAFSASAAAMGGMDITELPYDLPVDDRFTAYERLLTRILKDPDSFHNNGDFAQSLGFAFRHSLNVKRHHQLYAAIKAAMADGQNHALYLPLAMALAIACDDPQQAMQIDAQAKANPDLWPDDRMICATLGRITDHAAGNRKRATVDFLRLYLARHKTDPDQDSMAHYFLVHEPIFKNLFQIDDIVQRTFSYGRENERIFLFPVDDDLYGGALNAAFPLWIPGGDWPEMFDKRQITKNISKTPALAAKKFHIPTELKAAERDNFQTDKPLPEDAESLQILSVYAVALTLSGRYRRASRLHFHCRDHAPEHPVFLKRIANQFVVAGNLEKADRNLDRAAAILPDHPGIILARAIMAQGRNDHDFAVSLLSGIADQAFLPLSHYKAWELSLRKLKSREAARNVIAEAARRFKGHEIFNKQWNGKL